MKNKIILGLIMIFLLSGCFNNQKETTVNKKDNINEVENKLKDVVENQNDKKTEDKDTLSGSIDGDEKEKLKKVLDDVNNQEEKNITNDSNTGDKVNKKDLNTNEDIKDSDENENNNVDKEDDIKTEELINDLSDDFDKELDQEILNLLKQ